MTVHHPVVNEQEDLSLAPYGSFLTPASVSRGSVGRPAIAVDAAPGSRLVRDGEIVLNERRPTVEIEVSNSGDRPIQVGSHYHSIETNGALVFDRRGAYGFRLDIPAGTAVRFEPGETKTVMLVSIAGDRVIRGGNAWASGPVIRNPDLSRIVES